MIQYRLTHSYLLSGDDLPECGTCQYPLTVKHILVECVDLKDVRNKHFVASSIKDLFDTIQAHREGGVAGTSAPGPGGSKGARAPSKKFKLM